MAVAELAPVPGRTHHHRWHGRLVAAGVGVALLTLAGCAGQDAGTTSGGEVGAVAPAGPAPAGYSGGAADGTATGKGGPAVVPAVLQAPAVVVTGALTLRSAHVLRATEDLTRLVTAAGGRVDAQATTTGDATPDRPGGSATSTTTVRVPPAAVEKFVRDAGTLGSLESVDINRADASAEVADVGARLANARASVVRIRALLDRATRLSDVVLLESEMSKRQSDLEALEARQRVLADTTSLATLTVTIVATDAVAGPVEPATGFLAGLRAGWDAFATATVGALTVLGALTPFLLLALVLAGAGLLLARRRRPAPSTAVDQP